jgi:hypothetical protein
MAVIPVFVILGLLVTWPPQAVSQGKTAKLEVQVHYSGSGTVDEKHKIYVVLWDTPDFVSGQEMPVEMEPATSKDGKVTFSDVKKTPAYISAVFDPTGGWDAQSMPPEGSSLALYSKAATPGKPEPIDVTPGKTAAIELAFDDSIKMKAGGPAR